MKQTITEIKQQLMRLKREKLKLEAPVSFSRFLGYVNSKYELEWFHKVIADHCQMLLEGRIKNLMVFMPPQHGKSEIISRNFPAWALGRDPDLKIVGCSYSSDLAEQFSRSIQRTIDSREYQDIFPDTYLNGSNIRTDVRGYLRNVDIFEMVGRKGFYKAVGIGGSLTGTPVDIAIIDDPVKDANEANSSTYRQRVWDWYNTVLTTRLHNNSRQLFIMTRWHEDDLAGRIMKSEAKEWTVLTIPAICEVDNDGGLSSRKVGDALWPSRHSLQKLMKQKARSPRQFIALYQQHPVVEGGNIIKRDWFRIISKIDFKGLRYQEPMHFFLDTAYDEKKNKDNDPTGIVAACRIRNNIYITHAKKVWKTFPDLIRFLPEYLYANDYDRNSSTLRIEPKANGISVVQQLEDSTDLNVTRTPTPTDGKDVRLHAIAPKVECGRVYLVDGEWNEEFIDEVCGFPSKAHDEYVDLLGYAVNYFSNEDIVIPDNVGAMFAR
ncbi:MAG: terminase family protein [Bacteroidales bacterium]|nr:terminase family protein [Bacteroidales bacterium]